MGSAGGSSICASPPLFTPKGRPNVARGGAKRNPWIRTANPTPPRSGRNVPGGPRTRGCASLHPWLKSQAPSGPAGRCSSRAVAVCRSFSFAMVGNSIIASWCESPTSHLPPTGFLPRPAANTPAGAESTPRESVKYQKKGGGISPSRLKTPSTGAARRRLERQASQTSSTTERSGQPVKTAQNARTERRGSR